MPNIITYTVKYQAMEAVAHPPPLAPGGKGIDMSSRGSGNVQESIINEDRDSSPDRPAGTPKESSLSSLPDRPAGAPTQSPGAPVTITSPPEEKKPAAPAPLLLLPPSPEKSSILKKPVQPTSATSFVPPISPVRGGKGVTFAKSAPAKVTKPRVPRKKVPLAMYQSQISDNKIGIKLCIKKSVDVVVAKTKAMNRLTAKPKPVKVKASASSSTSTGAGTGKKQRARKRKALDDSDSDEMNYRRRRRRDSKNNNNEMIANHNNNHVLAKDGLEQRDLETTAAETLIHVDQSCWALNLPENVLHRVFQYTTASEGCLPTLVRLSTVSTLWRRVAMQPSLWHTMDLTTWVKERYRNELKLKWLIENRLAGCTDLNLANWKVMNVQCVMDRLVVKSPKLSGLILSGWKSLMSDHLMFIATKMKNLQRIDLSGINTEVNANKTAVGVQSLCNAVQAMGERLRHLHLANNRLGGLPQLINSLAVSDLQQLYSMGFGLVL